MSKSSTTQVLKNNAVNASEVAGALVRDKKFRKQIASAVAHATVARRRARARKFVLATTIMRLGADPVLRREGRAMAENVEKALGRDEKKPSHKVRNSLPAAPGARNAAAAHAQARK